MTRTVLGAGMTRVVDMTPRVTRSTSSGGPSVQQSGLPSPHWMPRSRRRCSTRPRART
jgi:hypothetical protein